MIKEILVSEKKFTDTNNEIFKKSVGLYNK